MKLLLDANLSWRLTTALAASFGDCAHVDYIGINIPAKDTEIWDFAKKNDYYCSPVSHLLRTWIKMITVCWKSYNTATSLCLLANAGGFFYRTHPFYRKGACFS